MQVIVADSVDHAFLTAANYVAGEKDNPRAFTRTESRYGAVYRNRYPVTTAYTNPTRRVLFTAERDANPFFHFMEALWMLGGRNDVAFLTQFVGRMSEFSDDGSTYHGAYGHRWRRHFLLTNTSGFVRPFDQLKRIVENLKKDPTCRRQVLQIWSSPSDLQPTGNGSKDLPCNLMAAFDVDLGRLNMTVFNRSNDIVWGCYGSNMVHFSMLHEYIASHAGLALGWYYQISNNWHVYEGEGLDKMLAVAGSTRLCPYETDLVRPFPLVTTSTQEQWDLDLAMFLSDPNAIGFNDPFFRRVAVPMMLTHQAYKSLDGEQRFKEAHAHADTIMAEDWRLAATQWITRRWQRWKAKNQ